METISTLKRRIIPVLKKNDVTRSSIFGSFARGEATKRSDIDLLVRFSKRKGIFDIVHLQTELEGRLGRPVDVMTYASIHPKLKKGITKDAVLIYEKK